VADVVLESATATFRAAKALAEAALAQVPDAQLHVAPTPESNSLSVIVRHIAGNLRSRWTEFLTSDGEKPWRHRDGEFEEGSLSRAQLLAEWEAGWATLFATLSTLHDADLARTVTIRREPHTVARAIDRQLSHYGYHVGQIVYVARMLVGPAWKNLSVPRGESETFNRKMALGRAGAPLAPPSPPR